MGQMLRGEDGALLLVNEDKQVFKVHEVVVVVWEMCEKRTEDEVLKEVASQSGLSLEQVKPAVSEIIAKLKEVKLVG